MKHSTEIIANVKSSLISKRSYLQCQTMLVPYKALYDSGCDISCVKKDVFRKIPIQQRPPRRMEHSPW
jgi:hypothetical protein